VALENAYYAPVAAKKVTHWPKPDKNGDGEAVWVEHTDGQGNSLGRDQARDAQNNVIYEYSAPEGFRNVASKEAGSDGTTDNYVKVDARGRVWRHPKTGHAAAIKPGATLIEHPNGDFELMEDDFSRYLFEKSHEKVDAPADTASVEKPKTDEELKAEADRAELEDFRAWKAAQADTTGKQD
jgi:hypothetical protein